LPVVANVRVIAVPQKVIRGCTRGFVANTAAKKSHPHIAIDETIARSSPGKKNDGILHGLTG
jgi:hypothetical protein